MFRAMETPTSLFWRAHLPSRTERRFTSPCRTNPKANGNDRPVPPINRTQHATQISSLQLEILNVLHFPHPHPPAPLSGLWFQGKLVWRPIRWGAVSFSFDGATFMWGFVIVGSGCEPYPLHPRSWFFPNFFRTLFKILSSYLMPVPGTLFILFVVVFCGVSVGL